MTLRVLRIVKDWWKIFWLNFEYEGNFKSTGSKQDFSRFRDLFFLRNIASRLGIFIKSFSLNNFSV